MKNTTKKYLISSKKALKAVIILISENYINVQKCFGGSELVAMTMSASRRSPPRQTLHRALYQSKRRLAKAKNGGEKTEQIKTDVSGEMGFCEQLDYLFTGFYYKSPLQVAPS